MADRRRYTEGSSARQLNEANRARHRAEGERYMSGSAAPAMVPQPRRKHQKTSHLTEENRRNIAARKAEKKAVTNAQIRYTAGMVVAIVIAVALCCYLLKLISDAGLDSMVDLNNIYDIATQKLGMVYSQPGQTLYYSQNSDDYVIQYKDVPEAK